MVFIQIQPLLDGIMRSATFRDHLIYMDRELYKIKLVLRSPASVVGVNFGLFINVEL